MRNTINVTKCVVLAVLALALILGGAGKAKASLITYTVTDAGNFGGYEDTNTSDTFTGTGFVGIYPNQGYAHLFGLENYGYIYSETELQVDVSALAGKTITSAVLSYNLLNGGAGSQSVTATSYTTTGTLSFNNSPPNDLGSTVFTSNGLSPNSVDVTSLLQSAITGGAHWFGLYLTPDGPGNNYQWTYTSGYGGDEADVRLNVTYGATAVPEPASLTLLGVGVAGLIGFAGLRRRKKAAQAA